MDQGSTAPRLAYTWRDYQSWDDGERWEIVAGEPYAMSPAPTPRHQRIQVELAAQFVGALRGGPCQALTSPLDVKLSDIDVVQPDVLVVCRPEQIRSTHIEGAPALVVEILSSSTVRRDRGVKMDAYARAGVREVWLITPWPQCVEVYVLDGNSYRRHGAFLETHRVTSPTLPELVVDLASVFDFPLAPGEEPPQVREPPARYGG